MTHYTISSCTLTYICDSDLFKNFFLISPVTTIALPVSLLQADLSDFCFKKARSYRKNEFQRRMCTWMPAGKGMLTQSGRIQFIIENTRFLGRNAMRMIWSVWENNGFSKTRWPSWICFGTVQSWQSRRQVDNWNQNGTVRQEIHEVIIC